VTALVQSQGALSMELSVIVNPLGVHKHHIQLSRTG